MFFNVRLLTFRPKKNQTGKGKRYPKNISSEDVQRLKGSRKGCKMNVQAWCEEKFIRPDKSLSLFPLQKKKVTWIQTTASEKKTFVEISQRMFSEIMSAFTEVPEMKIKNSEKCALFSIKCSRSALSIVDKIENWKNTRKKLLPSMRRGKMK